MARRNAEAERLQRVAALNSDPLNADAQRQIEEEIRMANVYDNMEKAIEFNPESFGRVVMLYVDCQVNKVPVKAFVDSGAQQTIMSVECAERCGIMRLVDRRFAGIAKGVGTARILGRVHLAPIKLGNSFFNCSFTILENQGMDFLLGLDMLKAHQCIIDLKDNALKIGKEAVPFLSEKDIPRKELDDFVPPQSPQSGPRTTSTTPGSSSTTSSAPKAPASSSGLSESTIQQLMSLGFSRDEVINALRSCNGNAEAAASYLFSGGF